jgi:hypothetical protein
MSSVTPEQLLNNSFASAKRLGGMLDKVKDEKNLFAELDESYEKSEMGLSIARLLVQRVMLQPIQDSLVSKGYYDELLKLSSETAQGYYAYIKCVRKGDNQDLCKKNYRKSILFLDSTGKERLLLEMRMPNLTAEEKNAVLDVQNESMVRMASEIDERITNQSRGSVYG